MATDAAKVEAIFFAVLDINDPQDRIAYLEHACGDDLELRRHVERLLEAHPKLGEFLNVQAADVVVTESTPIAEGPGTNIGRYKLLQHTQLLVPVRPSTDEPAFCPVCFSPDGRWLLAPDNSLSGGKTNGGKTVTHVRLWRWPSHDGTVLPVTHETPIKSFAISPDGTRGASLSTDGVVKVWSIPDGKLVWENSQGLVGDASNVAFYPVNDRHILAFSGVNVIGLWDIDTGTLLDQQPTDTGSQAIAISNDGRLFAASGSTGTIVWDVQDARMSKGTRITTERNGQLAFMHNDEEDILVAVGNDNWMVKLWNIREARPITHLVQRGWPQSMSISPNCEWLACATLDGVRLWNLKNVALNQRLAHPTNWPALAVAPDSRTVAAGGDGGSILLWDTSTNETVALSGHEQSVVDLTFSHHGDVIASTDDATVRLWNVASRRPLSTFETGGSRCVALSADGKWLVAGFTGKIRLWDLETGKSNDAKANGRVQSVRFSPDNRYVVSGGQRETVVWSVDSGTLLRTAEWPGWRGNVRAISFSPDGKTVAVPGVDAVGLWNWANDRKQVIPVGSPYPSVAAFSPDGETIVSTSPVGKVKFWQVASGEALGAFSIEGVRNLAIFPNGNAMVTASMNGTLKVWRIAPSEGVR